MATQRIIPFSPPDIGEAEIREVTEVLRSGWITTGPRTKAFEKELSPWVGGGRVVCLNSATAALELALRLLDIHKGDEVIVPAYTYTASASVVDHVGATIVFCDSQSDNSEMDYDVMESLITERTKAIIPVDLGGRLCDYERIFAAIERKKALYHADNPLQAAFGRIVVLADCAHALGAYRKLENGGREMSGAQADFSSFSFHAVKNLTTGEGGALTWRPIPGFDDETIYHEIQLLSLHGQSKDALSKMKLGSWEYDIVSPAYKCNMTDIMAAIGLKQLERYAEMLERRAEIVARYNEVADRHGCRYLIHDDARQHSSYHLYILRVPGFGVPERNALIEAMAEAGIACNVHYKPLPMMTAYKRMGFDIKNFPHAYANYEDEVTLPLHTCLTNVDVDYVCDTLDRLLSERMVR